MEEFLKLFKNERFKTIFVLVIFLLLMYFIKHIANILLLTLIFTLLVKRICELLHRILKIPLKYGVIIVYFIFILFLYIVTNYAFVEIKQQVTALVDMIVKFYDNPNQNNWLLLQIHNLFNQFDLKEQLNQSSQVIIAYAANITSIGISIIVSFILSFFYLLEHNRVNEFSREFLNSKWSWFFKECYTIGKKFVASFGIVLETQFIISFINSILTIIVLAYLGFPQLPILWLMVFILGLIPVAGVIISFVPLSFIGYILGGIHMVLFILVTIVIIHFLETYFLNPKLMSHRTHLPIFYVFLILFISETILGVWGLIVGIPIFIFIIDMLGVDAKKSVPQKKNILKRKPKRNKTLPGK